MRALTRSDEPIEVTFWHVQQAKNEETLQQLVERFEASQDRVRVRLVNMVSYPDLFEAYRAAMGTDRLPDIVQMDKTAVQLLIDSESTIPIGTCVEADGYELDDFLPRAIDQYTTDGTLRAMPWTVSTPVLIYDKNAFRAAGLDPESPPRTLADVTEFARQIVDSGAARNGVAVRAEASVNEALYARSGAFYMDHENGRERRATATRLKTKKGLKIWRWSHSLVNSGLGLFTGSQPENVDNLLALGNGDAAMTIDLSSVLGSVFSVLESGEFADVEVGVAPLPGLGSHKGVHVGDGSLWIPKSGTREEQAAAWELIKFLSETEQVVTFTVESQGGYVPIRESAADDSSVESMWEANPELQVPYEQLLTGSEEATALGPVAGGYDGVRVAVRDALTAMFVSELAPKKALAQAQQEATDAIQDYNERIGL